ncbi:dienelactone hydrolase endo-1,3,1,4-beta-D-glucanase [Lentinula edodes]|uniref:Dienelactone hydrolase endo-1,3,1,4-beta-D-glucanase n=1 Tax=Lentinula lateritia TaxID=40482 RepID=A0A9W9A9S0_9AGAR|nr:dienelactone hydrolase endo-1,3,1,4-beta-D-glucanase [Lentinula edodes]
MSFCEDCIKGVKHDGTPEGKWETINGVECYLPNAQFLVDGFAKNGFKTVAPDFFEKDEVPFDPFDSEEKRQAFDLQIWFSRHGPPIARPLLDKVIAALKGQGVTVFAATGYCYGGRLVFDLAFENITSASIANHPSHLKSPDDLEKYFSTSHVPLLLDTCTVNEQFPLPAQSHADVIFGEGKFTPGYKPEYFDGCTHGFATSPLAIRVQLGSYLEAIHFFCQKSRFKDIKE